MKFLPLTKKLCLLCFFPFFVKMSRISYHLFFTLFFVCISWGQQKSNDFTKRVGVFDGKINRLSGKSFINSRLNTKLNNRIRIEEWPTKYSPFGGKRFVAKNNEGLIKKRIQTKILPANFPVQERRSRMGNDRVMESDLTRHTSAASSVQFRDAVYAQLDKRVDDWMNNVNRVSLREINRYQFRKGRPSDPGFPVQQAGSEGKVQNLNTVSPNLPSQEAPAPQKPAGSSYWLGPRKTSVSGGTKPMPSSSPSPKPRGGFKINSKPVLGPKKVRIQVGAPE